LATVGSIIRRCIVTTRELTTLLGLLLDALKEDAECSGLMIQIKLIKQYAIRPADSHPVTPATHINTCQ